MAAINQHFCLKWNNHQSTLAGLFPSLLDTNTFVDCTLAAEGKQLQAHKVVLSACSSYFKELLVEHNDKHPIIIINNIQFHELSAMVNFMYRGEVNIAQEELAPFLKAAKALQIKGLTDQEEPQEKKENFEPNRNYHNSPPPSPIPRQKNYDRRESPPSYFNQNNQPNQNNYSSDGSVSSLQIKTERIVDESETYEENDDYYDVYDEENSKSQASFNSSLTPERKIDGSSCENPLAMMSLQQKEIFMKLTSLAGVKEEKSDGSYGSTQGSMGMWGRSPGTGPLGAPPFGVIPSGGGGSPEPAFTCETCHKKYRSKTSLNLHRRWECGKEPRFQCPFCEKRTHQKGNLKVHIMSRHRDKLEEGSEGSRMTDAVTT